MIVTNIVESESGIHFPRLNPIHSQRYLWRCTSLWVKEITLSDKVYQIASDFQTAPVSVSIDVNLNARSYADLLKWEKCVVVDQIKEQTQLYTKVCNKTKMADDCERQGVCLQLFRPKCHTVVLHEMIVY